MAKTSNSLGRMCVCVWGGGGGEGEDRRDQKHGDYKGFMMLLYKSHFL